MTDYACPTCHKLRVNTPSGSVCPDGHGGLFPAVPQNKTADAKAARAARLASLPVATSIPNLPRDFRKVFALAGLPGLWRRNIDGSAGDEAVWNGKIWHFHRDAELEAAVKQLGVLLTKSLQPPAPQLTPERQAEKLRAMAAETGVDRPK